MYYLISLSGHESLLGTASNGPSVIYPKSGNSFDLFMEAINGLCKQNFSETINLMDRGGNQYQIVIESI